jgi:hypothetical protein
MATPICIITPEGMKCLSSPLARHFPGRKACEVLHLPVSLDGAAKAAVKAVRDSIKAQRTSSGKRLLRPQEETEIARVVQLLIEADFDLTKSFTIVKA